MVDATASFDSNRAKARIGHSSKTEAPEKSAATVLQSPDATMAVYSALAEEATFSPSQSPAWIGAWIVEARPDIVTAVLSRAGKPALAMTLEVVAAKGFRIARFMGGSHANGNFPPLAADAGALSANDLNAMASAISRARPDIDMLSLERLEATIEGRRNPLLALPKLASPNLALAVDLEGGFDALLGRASGKRKRKKNRSQIRKFEAAGGHRYVEASTPAEAERLLNAFFEMKEIRFRKMGVADVFAPAEVRAFFRRLFTTALSKQTPDFTLDGLEIGGVLRAVTGSSRCGGRLVCEFGAIAEDDMAHASPGEFLFYENIKNACESGFSVYDFSVGDEPYKRLWCDIDIVQYDVFVPLTARGRLLATATRAKSRVKARVKNSRLIWGMVKNLRRRKGEKAGESQND
jgi:CelD/BcsL family acetyltransferase involved in cellulose biosynthesis